ncbi:MAG: type II toxin-antitoxin system RelE/ParE family toxin [Chloroflexi bacterium]|nr:type II toxin-antitoxin system RelE/ParE family toxin [Chloroflexota bacterium]
MRRRRVRLHRKFVDDVRRHRAWLAAHGQPERIENLLDAIREVMERLAAFPASGPIIKQDERIVVRELIFRRLHYVAHYAHRRRAPIADVWLLAPYGVGQDRPEPDPDAWVID